MRILSAAWRTSRPKQWTKNLLVLAAPLAAGELLRADAALVGGGSRPPADLEKSRG